MCSFVSWIELEGKIVYLNDDCVRNEKGRELKRHLGNHYQHDATGHAAIRWYFDLKDNEGINKERQSIYVEDYPEQIVKDIKNYKMTLIGHNIRFLTDSAFKNYLAIKNPAWKDYSAIEKSAYKDYLAIKNPAYKDYSAIENPALKSYLAIIDFALEKYLAIKDSAWKDYLAITKSTFWKLFKLKKNRIKQWQ